MVKSCGTGTLPNRHLTVRFPQRTLDSDRGSVCQITTSPLPGDELTYHDEDVFGQTLPGSIAHRFLTGTEPAQAWHMAKGPLKALKKAKFRIDYPQTLTNHPDNIVFEVDWNL